MSDPNRPALEGMPPRPERRALLDWLLGLSGAGALLAVVYPVVAFVFPPRQAKGKSKGAVLAGRVSRGGQVQRGSGFDSHARLLLNRARASLSAFEFARWETLTECNRGAKQIKAQLTNQAASPTDFSTVLAGPDENEGT